MAIPRIHYSQLLEIMKQIKSSVKSSGAVLIADKDKPPSAKMFEEMQQRQKDDARRREEEERADEDYWDEVFFGL